MAVSTLNEPRQQYGQDIGAVMETPAPDWLRQLRGNSAALFQETDFPHKRMEEWRQTNIASIVNTPYRSLNAPPGHMLQRDDIEPFLYGAVGWNELVFVDGFFAPELSRSAPLPDGVTAGSLAQALAEEQEGGQVAEHLNRYLKPRSAYTALNSALFQDGAFVHVPRNVAVEQPIHLVFVTNRQENETAAHLRNLFVLEESASAVLVSSWVSLAGETNYLNNVVEEVALGGNAELHRYKTIQEGEQGHHLGTTEYYQERDSRLHAYFANLRGNIARNQQCAELAGEGASCNFAGLYLNDDERLIDNSINVTHVAPHCSSRIGCKGILDGKSKTVFGGKVYVCQQAQQTDSDQLSNNLLLSDRATVDAKPQLEIYADDVKCTHGATVGAPPEEVIFYFRSRGIEEETARAMLTCGFAEEILDEFALDPVRERLLAHAVAKYRPER